MEIKTEYAIANEIKHASNSIKYLYRDICEALGVDVGSHKIDMIRNLLYNATVSTLKDNGVSEKILNSDKFGDWFFDSPCIFELFIKKEDQ